MTSAVLDEADLKFVDFSGADLSKASMRDAVIDDAIFNDAKLGRTMWFNLKRCRASSVGSCQ